PVHERRDCALPLALGARVLAGARAPRPRDRDARRGHRGDADGAGIHARGGDAEKAPPRPLPRRCRDANMQTVVLNSLYFPFVSFLSTAALAVVLGYGGYQYFQDPTAARLGTLLAFMLYVNNFFDPVQQLSQLYNTF